MIFLEDKNILFCPKYLLVQDVQQVVKYICSFAGILHSKDTEKAQILKHDMTFIDINILDSSQTVDAIDYTARGPEQTGYTVNAEAASTVLVSHFQFSENSA